MTPFCTAPARTTSGVRRSAGRVGARSRSAQRYLDAARPVRRDDAQTDPRSNRASSRSVGPLDDREDGKSGGGIDRSRSARRGRFVGWRPRGRRFDLGSRASARWDFQMLGLASHVGAFVLEIERTRLQLARAGALPWRHVRGATARRRSSGRPRPCARCGIRSSASPTRILPSCSRANPASARNWSRVKSTT